MWKKIKKLLNQYDSPLSFFVGVVFVVIIALLSFSFIQTLKQQNAKIKEQTENVLPTTYSVQEGDTLWDIAIEYYGSGYNWVDIQKENNLENPDKLEVGQALIIPETEPIIVNEQGDILDGASTDIVSPKSSTVTVAEGESLWTIAEREYGSGYKWVDIAKANVIITNPDLIYPTTILNLP